MRSDEKAAVVAGHRGDEKRRGSSYSTAEGEMGILGYKQELKRNRSMFTLLFQSLAIAAIPYGEGSALINAIYGGGQLAIFLGWVLVMILNECIAVSLAELASRYPTSGSFSYVTFQIAPSYKKQLAYINGWVWLIGNWTILLSVNFGFASFMSGTISMYHPQFDLSDWQLLMVFYAVCIFAFVVCALLNQWLPMIDTICAAWTAVTILIICVCLAVYAGAGRHSASYALGHYDRSLSGWGGFTFFIGLLPAAYTFSAIGVISSMADECSDPETKLPTAISLCVPVGGLAGFFFILPICFTLPPLQDIVAAPAQQALPYIFAVVMGTPGGGLGLMFLVLVVTIFCSISLTVAVSRCTWAFARDDAVPFARLLATVHPSLGVPLYSLAFITIIQMLLGLIRLGSSAAFTAFISVGVQALNLSYAIPIVISLLTKRREVNKAPWRLRYGLGAVANVIAVVWIGFELVLFSMPAVLPTSPTSMNYSVVVLFGFGGIAAFWYFVHSRKTYQGPPLSEGL